MKRLFLLTPFALFMGLCASAQNPSVKPVNASNPSQPYKIESSNISIGNMAYAQKVLRAWKDYDNNTLDNSMDMFAEDVLGTFPDGTAIKGKANLLAYIKEFRNGLESASSQVHACTALKSPDQPDREVVTIWGIETDTKKDGTVSKTHLNEVWFFNKQGLVTELHQLAAKDGSEKK